MTDTTTPTEGEVVDNSGVDKSTLPEDDITNNSAVENQNDTTSEDDTDQGSTDSTTENGEDEPQKAEASLKKFAKAQGYTDEDLENLSDREVKVLKLAQDQQRKVREQLQSKPKGEIEKTVNSVENDNTLDEKAYVDFRIRQRDMISDVRDYWRDNPQDVQYEAQAIALLQQEKETYGEQAMLRLAGDMPRLLREAKYQSGANDAEAISEKARREERERLRKIQEGSADGAHASTTEKSSKGKVTSEWIKNEYDPDNEEHRKLMDEFTASSKGIY